MKGAGGSRDLTARVRGLAKAFPVDWSEFYTRGLPGHVERTVLASMLADLDAAQDIDCEAIEAYRDVLTRYRGPLAESGRNDLLGQIDEIVHRAADPSELGALVVTVMAALPLSSAQGDGELERLHRAAVGIDVRAERAYTDAWKRYVGESADSEPGPSVAETDDIVASINAAVDAHYGFAAGTADGRVTAGGLSKVTLTYKLRDMAVVVRSDRGARYSGALVETEYRTIAAAYQAGIPAPKPVAFVEAVEGSHPAFSILECIDGSPLPGIPRFRDADMCRQLAEILAAIHQIPVDTVGHIDLGQSTVERVLSDLDVRRAEWRAAGCANPLTEFTFQWLRIHADDCDGPRVVLHGDYRPHNMLGVDRRITAVLDWEHGKIGNAAEDLAYVRPAAEALASWPEFLHAYVGAGGREPSEREMRFCEVSGSLFNTTILDQMEIEFAADESRPLTMIATVLQHRPIMRGRMVDGMSIAP